MLHSYAVFESEQVIASKLEDRDDDCLSVDVAADTSVGLKKITQRAAGQPERRVILETLEANAWHRRLAARSLGISYRTLLYKMRKAGFPPKRSRLCAAEHPGVKANLRGRGTIKTVGPVSSE
jgi:transcriptional regulator with GAF, ATPase, and Fis domain